MLGDVLIDNAACVRSSECYSWTRYRERVVVKSALRAALINTGRTRARAMRDKRER